MARSSFIKQPWTVDGGAESCDALGTRYGTTCVHSYLNSQRRPHAHTSMRAVKMYTPPVMLEREVTMMTEEEEAAAQGTSQEGH